MAKMKLNNYQDASDLKPMAKLLAEGEATFLIRKVYTTDKDGNPLYSSKNDPMVKLQITVTDKNNDEGTLYDFCTPNTLWKIHSICQAIGKPELYQPEFDYEQLQGAVGKLNIMIEDRPGYPRRNGIKNYIKMKEPAASKYVSEAELAAFDDSIPF